MDPKRAIDIAEIDPPPESVRMILINAISAAPLAG
jgi:hypothetical protein